MLQKILLLLLISFNLYSKDIALADLVFLVSKKDSVNIIFSHDVSKSKIVDFPFDYKNTAYLPVLKSILKANGLNLVNDGGIYIVTLSDKTDSSSISSAPADTVKSIFTNVQPDLQSFPVIKDKIKIKGKFTSESSSKKIDKKVLDSSTDDNSTIENNSTSSAPVSDSFVNSENNSSFLSVKLDYLQFHDVKALLDFSGLQYVFSPVNKTIIFKDDPLNSKYLNKLLDEIYSIDTLKQQVTLKITIFSTNQSKLKEVGFNPSLNFDFNLISQSGALLDASAVIDFKSSLKFLSSKGVTNVSQSTAYVIADNEKLDFKQVVSIPVLDENFALTTDNGTNQSKKYKYKDVGFKVSVIPTIVNDTVYLDFSLTTGDVVSTGDLPVTTENSITNKFSLKKGGLVLLAGISKFDDVKKNESLPFVETIPFLKDIFTHVSDTSNDETFNISIEILE